jgi:glycosyltransferase involved in cell wall biosynthesis
MNILHVTLAFPPALSWGGPVKNTYRNCKELVRRGHQVTVYSTNLLDKRHKIQPKTCERNIDGIRVVYFNTWNIPWWPGTLGPFWTPDISRIIRQEIERFDLVHLHGYRSLMFLQVVRAARQQGVPIVTQPHGTLPVIVSSFWLKQAYDRFFGSEELKEISALIALQESEKGQALTYGIPTDRIKIIPNAIDPQELAHCPEYGSFRKKYNIDINKEIVLFVGRINRIKGVDMLVEAFSLIQNKNALLVIAGPDNGQLKEVQQRVKEYQLDKRVLFTGLLSNSEVYSAFQDSDIFVLPSRSEAFPTIIIEGCLVGIPMVITDRCEISEMVKGRIAEVVPFDATAFATAIDHLLSDKELRQTYKENCKMMLVDTFSLDTVIDRLEAVYRDIVEKKNP